ncbi:hypothetical protein STTU_5931 [Streptomyces sp. Tu6071]|nr:hypothetical protein STTU_5931 [Streptomyces sp. Tu6071]
MRGAAHGEHAGTWAPACGSGRGASELQAAEERGEARAPGLDARGDRRTGEVEAEEGAHDHVHRLQAVLPAEEEDDDAEQDDAGDGQDHEVLLVEGTVTMSSSRLTACIYTTKGANE